MGVSQPLRCSNERTLAELFAAALGGKVQVLGGGALPWSSLVGGGRGLPAPQSHVFYLFDFVLPPLPLRVRTQSALHSYS